MGIAFHSRNRKTTHSVRDEHLKQSSLHGQAGNDLKTAWDGHCLAAEEQVR